MENQEPEKVRITITLDRDKAETIAELAERMGASQSRMASMLVEAGLEDHEWIIRFVTSRAVKGLKELLAGNSKAKRKSGPRVADA